jgi:NadR type nicotinamide-nucleotide adenylyltransferase
MIRGLVIGKFYPPHRGHSYLIDTALSQSDKLDVLVCDSPSYRISADTRMRWLRHVHPHANIRVIADIGKDDDSQAWAKHTLKFLGYTPDIVFTSEDYGKPYAAAMGCKHQLVDRVRKTVPISGTQIRADVHTNWQFLSPVVRATFCKRICVVGAESTGTTTLARALARHYATFWVPEYGRMYTEAMLSAGPDVAWDAADFMFIADQQQILEDKLAGKSNGLLICDTNAAATHVWRRRYLGSYDTALKQYTNKPYALYIITAPDIPFEQDGTRDGDNEIRAQMHTWFIAEVKKTGIPYIIVKGAHSQRLAAATMQIDTIIKTKVTI